MTWASLAGPASISWRICSIWVELKKYCMVARRSICSCLARMVLAASSALPQEGVLAYSCSEDYPQGSQL